jgi:hypothetical protein
MVLFICDEEVQPHITHVLLCCMEGNPSTLHTRPVDAFAL